MSRNYGVNRKMEVAGRMVVNRKFHGGFQSKYDIAQRFAHFCKWAAERGVKKMELVTFELVAEYGKSLQAELDAGLRTSSSAPKNYVSAVNTVMRLATRGQWKSVKPGADCGITPRKYIPVESRAMPERKHTEIKTSVDPRVAALMELQREFGMRFKESCLFSPKRGLRELEKTGYIVLRAGTKGGKVRTVPCGPEAVAVIKRAAAIQDGRSMIPAGMSYVEFRRECYRQATANHFGFHAERHHYAHRRYGELAGAPPPVTQGWSRRERIDKLAEYLGTTKTEAKIIDSQVRLEIAKELGHNREGISSAYLG